MKKTNLISRVQLHSLPLSLRIKSHI